MKVWIFGDSFAELKPRVINGWEWQVQVSNFFKRDLYNIAHNGASSEWLTLQMSNYLDKISVDDFVIVLIPYWDRQCIFPDNPDFTHLVALDQYNKDRSITDRWNKYTKEQREAFRQYFTHLHNVDLTKLKTLSLYSWVNNLNLTTPPLIIELRDQDINNHFRQKYKVANGYLMDVSVAEWADISIWNNLTKKALYDDMRVSHLCKKNHTVLADKIINYFKDGTVVDLTNNFYSNFLNKDGIDNTN